jgi:mannose/cellobiose epimerase-like protein (N-acyl-D-glucosamine 2-epimerase family)/anti-anti-sigma regulatory factor
MTDKMHFTFTDTIAGTVTSFDEGAGTFGLATGDDREFEITVTSRTVAEILRNMQEPYVDATGQIHELLEPGRYLLVYGSFYPEGGDWAFEAQHIVFVGRTTNEYVFEAPDWWVNQIRALANFWMRAEFGDGEIDFHRYRTELTSEGVKTGTTRQETDTISRLVYGFASAYMLTGEDRFLEAAEKGTDYLRDHMRTVDAEAGTAFWVHAIDYENGRERKILASEFGDDYDAIPAYEQIYALVGPAQTHRITGDPQIRADIDMTIELFERYFHDPEGKGYFSHMHPVTFDPRDDELGHNRARKNWNSVGDHVPAYLINTWLATEEDRYADMLAYIADTVVEHFPDYDNSPFFNERFHEDWTPDQEWGWQENRAVVGHNLKIAWNLMRIQSIRPSDRYVELAKRIAEVMPEAGGDRQRGGYYDVVERQLEEGREWYSFTWHDRKAWWQQEQAILAYLILAGVLDPEAYLPEARRSIAFYNAYFLDHQTGGIFFNVLANGIPYMLGTERMKGSHAMAGYHSLELAFLAAVYTNLLITKQPLELYFKPKAGAFGNSVLRVAPDILPPGSIRIEEVLVDDQPYDRFDAEGLTVTLPPDREVRVKVRLVPSEMLFESRVQIEDGTATVTVRGRLEDSVVRVLERDLEQALRQNLTRVVVRAEQLESISSSGTRALLFLRQKLPFDPGAGVYVVGAPEPVRDACRRADADQGALVIVDEVSEIS